MTASPPGASGSGVPPELSGVPEDAALSDAPANNPPVAWRAAGSGPPGRLDRTSALPTVLVGVIIAAVVLGGRLLDGAIAVASAGTVDAGGVQVQAAPGWRSVPVEGNVAGVRLQRGDVLLDIVPVPGYTGAPKALLSEVMSEADASNPQIAFGDVQEGNIGAEPAAAVTYQATNDSAVTVDGEVIAVIVGGDALIFNARAPQGDLEPATDDIVSMVEHAGVHP